VRIRVAGARLSVLADKALLPPFGVRGGGSGAPNRFRVRRGGQPIEPSPLPGKVSGFPLEPGDVVIMESSGGGGFGDPLDRDPALVAADLAEGYVTPAVAEAVYGVVVTGGAIDAAATAARRAALRAARPRVRLGAGPGLDTERGRAIRLDAGTAARLGVGEGAVVELVNLRGAPLRAWVTFLTPGSAGRAEVAPIALRMLGTADGAAVEIRAVHGGTLSSGPGPS
jgi:N-methylhydantoinase B